ncbi:mitochondrial acyl carrier protein 3 [Actinidia rufa]|uniref:Mitochondrial acyl carrier protein 3 n=1 Tax=Actinidia rufa TaxID=165716 RepID=A0A7J0FXC6_9ERIC|nr:mitochondrial acyl carrier protein 3 [Actinidia rufa]
MSIPHWAKGHGLIKGSGPLLTDSKAGDYLETRDHRYVCMAETADFEDWCIESLDRVELVVIFEHEFSIEIPDKNAGKLSCCADVAKYSRSCAVPKNMRIPD